MSKEKSALAVDPEREVRRILGGCNSSHEYLLLQEGIKCFKAGQAAERGEKDVSQAPDAGDDRIEINEGGYMSVDRDAVVEKNWDSLKNITLPIASDAGDEEWIEAQFDQGVLNPELTTGLFHPEEVEKAMGLALRHARTSQAENLKQAREELERLREKEKYEGLYRSKSEQVTRFSEKMAGMEAERDQLREEADAFREALNAVAEPFPGKPEEGWNWPDLWKNLGDMARTVLAKYPKDGSR